MENVYNYDELKYINIDMRCVYFTLKSALFILNFRRICG